MAEQRDGAEGFDPVRRLADAIREVKNASADRDDVVVDMREAQRGRLELLAADLAPVFAEVPRDDQQFDFAISSGLQPRLWVDATAHVAMGRDRREYRFVRDTRLGRVVLAESHDLKAVAASVTRYVAERIVERQRMIDGDVPTAASGRHGPGSKRKPGQFLAGLLLVLLGAIAGASVLAALTWERLPPLLGGI